jgi:DEAD/DEAH box helicase domain-containing protein
MVEPQELQPFPPGVAELLRVLKAGEPLPSEFDHVWAGFDSPHRAFPLRAVPGPRFTLVDDNVSDQIGTIEHEKAIREAHPGATYLHFGQIYRVSGWRSFAAEQRILLRKVPNAPRTHALISTHVRASLAPNDLIEGRLLRCGEATLAETRVRVADTVVGYRVGGKAHLFSDLSKTDRRLSSKRREFETTGVLVRLPGTLFDGDTKAAVDGRRQLAEAIAAVAAREFGLAPADFRTAHTGVALQDGQVPMRVNDAVMIFDNVSGGLRLTSSIFDAFGTVIERLRKGAQAAGEDALLDEHRVDELAAWYEALRSASPAEMAPLISNDGEVPIFAPGSVVGVEIGGTALERRLFEPQLLAVGEREILMYRYESAPGVSAWVAHDKLQIIGDDWRRALWSPITGAIRELAA